MIKIPKRRILMKDFDKTEFLLNFPEENFPEIKKYAYFIFKAIGIKEYETVIPVHLGLKLVSSLHYDGVFSHLENDKIRKCYCPTTGLLTDGKGLYIGRIEKYKYLKESWLIMNESK